MPGSITPLPVMLEEEDRRILEAIEPPKSIVVRFGFQKLVAELPYTGDTVLGCGSKLIIRTKRGMELGEMLTTTCANAGCGKSISLKQMLDYIENSGGKDYPFSTHGKVLRVAAVEDLQEQARMDLDRPKMMRFAMKLIEQLKLPMKVVDIELLLGGERVIFHYTSDQWVDFRDLVRQLASEYQTRIEMRQVNDREEARLVADYERCGQHCCCKQFLKVLKPVSMRSAKVQKATLDPAKISGRCGRLMCCLRYEDQTYETLRKKLPHKQSRVMTEDGPGTVIDSQILTQLVLVQLDDASSNAAYPVENISPVSKATRSGKASTGQGSKPQSGGHQARNQRTNNSSPSASSQTKRGDQAPQHESPEASGSLGSSETADKNTKSHDSPQASDQPQSKPKRRRRRGRKRRQRGDQSDRPGGGGSDQAGE